MKRVELNHYHVADQSSSHYLTGTPLVKDWLIVTMSTRLELFYVLVRLYLHIFCICFWIDFFFTRSYQILIFKEICQVLTIWIRVDLRVMAMKVSFGGLSINHSRLFNAKSSIYIFIKYIWFVSNEGAVFTLSHLHNLSLIRCSFLS